MDDFNGEQQESNLSGTVVRGYEVKNLIGAGGFGAVYRAYQPAIDRDVALKVILPQYANHPDFIRSFESEARIIARLEHLHIVPLYDFWREPDSAFLVMRWLKGGSLTNLIKKGPIPPEETARFLDQIASALSVAHRNGIVHRDIKPDNILVDEEENAFLTDFGIAKDLQEDLSKSTDDVDEELTGSPAYFSPEQAQAEPVSTQSDIYSLGIVLFQMLTGRLPYSTEMSLIQLILAQINEPMPSLLEFKPELPEALDVVVQRATMKSPDARYPDVRAMALDFRRAVTPTVQSSPERETIPVTPIRDTDEIVVSVGGDDEGDTFKLPKHVLADLMETSHDNPYKGLRPFEEADSDDFFGREALIDRLLNRLREDDPNGHFLAVIGPSGSGKSSVVKAGLLPALRWGALQGSDHWFLAEMVPSTDPYSELETALLSVAVGRHSNLKHQLRNDERGLLDAMARILPGDDTTLLLVIDQFEELFTQVDDEDTRAAFLNGLLVAMSNPDSRLRVIVTLRADFFDRPLLYPGFGELLRKRNEVVLPLSREEMERAIVGPAERVGLNVEEALIAAVITEVSEQPGALPLLQYSLTEVFERREGDTLTASAYQASGGVLGALARRAEELYLELNDAEQEATRQLFLRLVTLGEGTEDTRRRMMQGDYLSIATDRDFAQKVLDLYSRYRLLTFDTDPVTRNPTVEVAHEALIREWKRLRAWLDNSRDDVRTQQRVASAALEWTKQNKDSSFLASGMRLDQFEEFFNKSDLSLSEDEQAYIQASLAERDRLAAEEKARRKHEKSLEFRARMRLRALVTVMFLAAVVATVFTLIALDQRGKAKDSEAQAIANEERAIVAEENALDERDDALVSNSRTLATLALNQLTVDPVASIILALRALPSPDNPRPYTPNAEFALTQGVQSSTERAFLDAFPGGSVTQVAYGEDQIAIAGVNLLLSDYDLNTVSPLEGHAGNIGGVEWSADNRLMSFGQTYVIVWDRTEIGQQFVPEGEIITDAHWQPDNTKIAIRTQTGIWLWEPDSDAERILDFPSDLIVNASWSPDGQHLAAWTATAVKVWSGEENPITQFRIPNNAQEIENFGANLSSGVAWSPDSDRLLLIFRNFTAQVRPLDPDADIILLAGHQNRLNGGLFTSEGQIITWSQDDTIRLWSADGDEIAVLGDAISVEAGPIARQRAGVNGVLTSPDATRLLAWRNDGTATIIDLATLSVLIDLAERPTNITDASWSDNRMLATAYADSSIRVWDTELGTEIIALYGHTDRAKGLYWRDPRHLLSYAQDGTVRLWQIFGQGGLPMGRGLVDVLGGHRGRVQTARWANNSTILSNAQGGSIRRWSLETDTFDELPNPDNSRWIAVWSPDHQFVLRYIDGGVGEVWDWEGDSPLYTFDGSINIGAAFWLENGIFIGSESGDLTWYDAESGDVLGILSGHRDSIHDIALSMSTNQLATASADTQILIWQLPDSPDGETLSPSATLTNEDRQPVRIIWSQDGVRLLSGGFNGDVVLWDTQAQTILLELVGHRRFPARDAQFSPDETMIVAPIDTVIFGWDLDGKLIFEIETRDAAIGTQWFQSNNRLRSLTWGLTGAQVWDIPSGVEVLRLGHGEDQFLVAAFNDDGSQILTGTSRGQVQIWRSWATLDGLIAEAETCCVTRPLSPHQLDEFGFSD